MGWEYTSPGGSGSGGGMVIGDPIGNSPIANAVLFVSAAGNLANSANFKWDDGVEIIAPATTDVPLTVSAPSGQTADILKTEVNSVQTATINAAGEFTNSPGTATDNESFGADGINPASTGDYNAAFGANSMPALSSGASNTAVGYNALNKVTTGSQNTAIGNRALEDITTTDYNVAVGQGAGISNTGTSNTFIGTSAGLNNITGTDNVFIGYQAGYNETGSNKLVITNANVTDPLISGDFSAQTLQFEAAVDINIPTISQVGLRIDAGLTQTANMFEAQVNSTLFAHIDFEGNFSNARNRAGCEFFGKEAGPYAATGNSNTGLGYRALNQLSSGNSNVCVGNNAGRDITTGSNNTFVGKSSGQGQTLGHHNNTAVGWFTMWKSTSGDENTILGSYAMYDTVSGNRNTALGTYAGENNATGSDNVFIGYKAGQNETGSDKLYIANSNTATPLIGGDFSTAEVTMQGTLSITCPTVNDEALILNSQPSHAVNIFEVQTDLGLMARVLSGGNFSNDRGNPSCEFFGAGTGPPTLTGDYNTGMGNLVLTAVTNGVSNTGVGYAAMQDVTTGDNNTGLGNLAGNNILDGLNNTFVGSAAGQLTTSASNSTAVGFEALYSATTNNANTAVGMRALKETTGGFNTAVGVAAGGLNVTGVENTFLGWQAGQNVLGDGNVCIGYAAGMNETGSDQLYIANSSTATPLIGGDFATGDLTFNAAVEIDAPADADVVLTLTAGASQSVNIFEAVVNSVTQATVSSNGEFTHNRGSGAANETFGLGSMNDTMTGASNTGFGRSVLQSLTDGIGNVGVGRSALLDCTEGDFNIAMGYQAAQNVTDGIQNIALGQNTLDTCTTGDRNIAIGQRALATTNSTNNVAIGYQAGQTGTGGSNIFIGYQAGQNETGSNKLYIANSNTATPLIGGDFSTGDLTFVAQTAISAPALTDDILTLAAASSHTGLILECTVNSVREASINGDGQFTHSPGTGGSNEAFGDDVMNASMTGVANAGFGRGALLGLTSGNYNCAFGRSALNDVSSGASNTAIGYQAGTTITTTSGGVFIGYQAGKNETLGNKLYIANSDTATPLIYGDFATSALTVNGTQKITDSGSDVLTLASTGTGARAGLVCDNDSSVQFQLFMGGSLHGIYPNTGALVIDDGYAFSIAHASATPRMYFSSGGSIGIGTTAKPTANDGAMLFFKDKGADPTLASNTAGIYGDDFSGTVRMKVMDEDGDTHYLTGAYGEIKVESNSTATSISSSSSDFSNKVQVTIFDTNGLSRGTTPDHTNDHITVNDDGVYKVSAVISFSGGTGDTISFAVFKNNGATQLTTRGTRELGATDVGNATIQGLADLSVNDTIELWIQNETNSTDVTIEDATLIIEHV